MFDNDVLEDVIKTTITTGKNDLEVYEMCHQIVDSAVDTNGEVKVKFGGAELRLSKFEWIGLLRHMHQWLGEGRRSSL